MATITADEAGSKNIVAFLDLIAWSEGTEVHPLTRNHGYDTIVNGIDPFHEVFTDFSTHPFEHRPAKLVAHANANHGEIYSTASGRYQLLKRLYDAYTESLHLPDFSPLSQDLIAIQQMREKHVLEPLQAGNIVTAVNLAHNLWASFPGNSYGQGGHSMQALLSKWATLVN